MATEVTQISPCPQNPCDCNTTPPVNPPISATSAPGAEAEYLFNGGGPGNVNFDLERSLQGKGRTLVFLTATAPAGATSVSLSSTTGLKAGDQLFFSPNGFGSGFHAAGVDFQVGEVSYVADTFVPGSLTVPLVSALTSVHTGAAISPPADPVAYDVFAANGPGLNEILPDGIELAVQAIYDDTSTLEKLVQSGSKDGAGSQNSPETVLGLVNGAATTSELDRARSQSSANTTVMQTPAPIKGVQMTSKPAGWTATNETADGAATVTVAAGAAGVRHVVTSITASLATGATPQVPVIVRLLDGATVVWQAVLAAVAGTSASIALSDLAIAGSPATALTLAFSGTEAGELQAVSMTGYDIA